MCRETKLVTLGHGTDSIDGDTEHKSQSVGRGLEYRLLHWRPSGFAGLQGGLSTICGYTWEQLEVRHVQRFMAANPMSFSYLREVMASLIAGPKRGY